MEVAGTFRLEGNSVEFYRKKLEELLSDPEGLNSLKAAADSSERDKFLYSRIAGKVLKDVAGYDSLHKVVRNEETNTCHLKLWLLVVGTANDIFIYNMARWLKASMAVETDVFECCPSQQQSFGNTYYNRVVPADLSSPTSNMRRRGVIWMKKCRTWDTKYRFST